MPELNLEMERAANGAMILHLEGFLDAHTFEELDEAINGLFDEGVYRIVVDLSELDYISSAGAGVFIGALAEAQENGGKLVLASLGSNVREVFDLLGLTQIFTIVDSVDAAIAAF